MYYNFFYPTICFNYVVYYICIISILFIRADATHIHTPYTTILYKTMPLPWRLEYVSHLVHCYFVVVANGVSMLITRYDWRQWWLMTKQTKSLRKSYWNKLLNLDFEFKLLQSRYCSWEPRGSLSFCYIHTLYINFMRDK